MTEEFYVKDQGWKHAPHGLGHWQESYHDDVLASRHRLKNDKYSYCLYVHNLCGTLQLSAIIPAGEKHVSLWSDESSQVDDCLVQQVIEILNLSSPQFVNFSRMPILERICCAGAEHEMSKEYEEEAKHCSGEATYWVTNQIDGYTSSRIAVCDHHCEYWTRQFGDFLMPREAIEFN